MTKTFVSTKCLGIKGVRMEQQAGWRASLEDPFRAELLAAGSALPE